MSSGEAVHRSPFIVGVAGGSGSGKTTLCDQLTERLGDLVSTLSCDSYYHDQSQLPKQERESLNFDHPDSIDFELLVKHLGTLKRGKQLLVPEYCFETHTRRATQTILECRPVILIEGILLYVDSSIREQLDLRLYVDAEPETRYLRRLRRDVEERGRSEQSVRRQWDATVIEMHRQFVAPTQSTAHVTVHTDEGSRQALEFLVAGLSRIAAH